MSIDRLLICIGVFIILSVFQNLIYAKKENKAKLALMVPIAAFFSVVVVILVIVYSQKYWYLLEQLNLSNYEIVSLNAMICIVFMLIKLIAGAFMIKGMDRSLVELTASKVYGYDDVYDKWFLLENYVNYRSFLCAIRWGIVVAGGFLAYYSEPGGKTDRITILLPCIAVIIINEIYHFINGQTKEEYEHSIIGTEADSRKIGQYFRVREILEKLLPEPLMSAQTGFELMGRHTAEDFVKELALSDDKIDKITSEYFYADNRYMEMETDGVQMTLDLMHHRNVIVLDPFYRDLDLSLTLPIVNTLLSGKKCVVITGRMSTKDDIRIWLKDMVSEYTHMPSLWSIEELSETGASSDVGILGFPELYDSSIFSENKEFFDNVGFALLIEPSVILSTGQIALGLLAERMERNEQKPVYCVCDRITDGLVDTVSHVLKSEFIHVTGTPVPRCVYTGMTWDAAGDFARQQFFDKQTKYLGNGIELAAIAIKNQIPHVNWYGETKAPIKDIKWIAGQYYPVLSQYMNIPIQQNSIYEKIGFIPNIWSVEKQNEQFAVVEDEFFNMFATLKMFLSRGKYQSFVNVLADNYLLRDYMRCNQQMFLSNPNAVPSFVPDYAKTERNTLIKLLIRMTHEKVSDREVLDEFHLVGCDSDNAYDLLVEMLSKFTNADRSILEIEARSEEINALTKGDVNYYSISTEDFRTHFSTTLAKAYYIVEEETNESEYVDAKFFNHVTQVLMPGQFVTYGGKYYFVKHISPQTGVILRRASDNFNERKYYRQIRTYNIDRSDETIISVRRIMDIEIAMIQSDLRADTTGYLEMKELHNLRTARVIDLSDDPLVGNYSRHYKNKTVMRIQLPEADERIRFTLSLLLMEIFKTLYPEGYPYIAVATKGLDDVEGILNYILYPVTGDIEDGYIYIIEDSDIDLGLLESIERNFLRIMEIAADYLSWHFEKMREAPSEDPVPPSHSLEREASDEEKRGLFARLANSIRKLLGSSKKEKPVTFDVDENRIKEIISEINNKEITEEETESAQKDDSASEHNSDDVKSDETTEVDMKEETQEEAPDSDEAVVENDEAKESAIDKAEDENNVEDEPEADEAEIENTEAEETAADKADDENDEAKEPEAIAVEDSPGSDEENKDAESGTVIGDSIPPRRMTKENDKSEDNTIEIEADDTDIFDESETGDIDHNMLFEYEFAAAGLTSFKKTRYQKKCFLKFGYEEIDTRLHLDDTMKYLRVRGWTNNALTQARKREVFDKSALDLDAVNHCDFCGRALSGVSYELMNDGRIRCNDCSATAITTVEELRKLFYQSLQLMEAFYGIKYRVPVNVEMVDARVLAKSNGRIFRPTKEYTPRVIGFATHQRGKYSVKLENGSPRLVALETMVHEMTHIWQFINWNEADFWRLFDMGDPDMNNTIRLLVYEGMAMWSSIQYLYQIGETKYADEQERNALNRLDEYGIGFSIYTDQYPLVKDGALIKFTPFSYFPPVDPDKVKAIVRALYADKQ